jgi:hypothetical protein
MSESEFLLVVVVFLASVVLGFINASNRSINHAQARPKHKATDKKINQH